MQVIVYMSRFARALTEDDLRSLERQSMERNVGLEVTGVLLHDQRRFMQAIEGPSENVRRLMDRITLDERHREISYVYRGPIQRRQFEGWSMRTAHLNARLSLAELRLQVADLLVKATEPRVKAAFFGFAATSR